MPVKRARSISDIKTALMVSHTIYVASELTAYHGSNVGFIFPKPNTDEVLDLTDKLAVAIKHVIREAARIGTSSPKIYRLEIVEGTKLTNDTSVTDQSLFDGTVTFNTRHGIGLHFRIWNPNALWLIARERVTSESEQELHDRLG